MFGAGLLAMAREMARTTGYFQVRGIEPCAAILDCNAMVNLQPAGPAATLAPEPRFLNQECPKVAPPSGFVNLPSNSSRHAFYFTRFPKVPRV